MEISTYVLTQILPLAAALYVLGVLFKHAALVKDNYIPLILLVLGIAGAFGLLSLANKVDVTNAIIQGTLATGLAILVNQGYKQLFVKKD